MFSVEIIHGSWTSVYLSKIHIYAKGKINSSPVVCYKLTGIVEDHTNVYRDIDKSNNMAGSLILFLKIWVLIWDYDLTTSLGGIEIKD